MKPGLGRGGAEPTAVEVSRDDQTRINCFGRLNNRLEEINDELSAFREKLQNIEDAEGALELVMDDGDCLMGYGDVFIEGTEDQANEFVANTRSKTIVEVRRLESEKESIEAEMKELKATLYAKFGNNINLETK